MGTVTRITPMSERELAPGAAMLELARDIMAGQARDGAPRVNVTADGRVSLTYSDGQRIHYVTGMDAGVPIGRA